MELQNTQAQMASPTVQQTAPPPAEQDGRATADTAKVAKDPTPEVPLPMPASPSQTGLVSKSALPEKDTSPKVDLSGASASQRTLKPYGISMLPDRQDPTEQKTPDEA